MKKIILIVGMLSVASFQMSCKKDGDNAKTSTTAKVDNLDDANNIIDFNNNILAEYKNKTKHIESILKYADAAVKKSSGEKVFFMPIVTPAFSSKKAESVPVAFGKDKDALDKDFKVFKDKYDNIKNKYEELRSYIAAEDFKDDKGAKATKVYKEIEADSEQFFTAGENILSKMKSAVDVAEEISLKDHPLKSYIVSSKKVNQAMDDAFSILDKQYVAEKFNESEAQKAYDNLAKSLEANTAQKFDVKDAQYSYKTASYESYNKSVSSYLDSFRKLIRDSKAAGKISESDIKTMDSAYDSVISSYNNFIN